VRRAARKTHHRETLDLQGNCQRNHIGGPIEQRTSWLKI
jgi:hypothetical protein